MHIYNLTYNCNSVRQVHAYVYHSPIMSVMVKLLAVNVFNANMHGRVDKNSTFSL